MGFISSNKFKILFIIIFMVIVYQTCKLYSNRGASINLPATPITVTVYYEALCPDSKHFFARHLEPTREKLKENLALNLIPYGKAKTFTSPEGDVEFECQHGEMECFANKIHACVIEKVQDPDEQLEAITCMIKDNMDPEAALKRCLKSYDPDPILECSKSTHGAELLKNYGIKTAAVNPSFIPTIYIGDIKGNQAALLKNFMIEICTYYSQDAKPPPCL